MSASGGVEETVTVVPVANPALGADWSYTLTQPGILIAVGAILTTSATVANRLPRLRFTDNAAHILCDAPGQSTEAASTAIRFCWFMGAVNIGTGGDESMGLPMNLVMQTGWTIGPNTANIDAAGDQWSGIVLTFDNR